MDVDINSVRQQIRENFRRAPTLSAWRHRKSGDVYLITDHVIGEKLLEPMVSYSKETKPSDTWCRPAEEFFDGRFERIDEGAEPEAQEG